MLRIRRLAADNNRQTFLHVVKNVVELARVFMPVGAHARHRLPTRSLLHSGRLALPCFHARGMLHRLKARLLFCPAPCFLHGKHASVALLSLLARALLGDSACLDLRRQQRLMLSLDLNTQHFLQTTADNDRENIGGCLVCPLAQLRLPLLLGFDTFVDDSRGFLF